METIKRSMYNEDSIYHFLIYIYIALSFFEPYLNGIIGSVTKYYILFLIAVIIYKNKLRIELNFFSGCLLFWLAYRILSLLWSQDYTLPQAHFLSIVLMVLFAVVIWSTPLDKKVIDGIITTCWLFSAVLGILSIFFSESYHGTAESRQVLVMFGVEVDPNNQAAFILIGVAISIVYLFIEKRRRILSICILLVNSFACLMTASRAAFLTLIALAFLCVIATEENGTVFTFFRKLLLIAAVFLVAYVLVVRFLPSASFERIFSFDTYEGGSERSIVWANAWELYTTDPFTVIFGVGWGTAAIYTGTTAGQVHNTFLAMLCDVGLLGTITFFFPCIKATVHLFRKKAYFPVAIFVAQMVPSFFVDFINKRFFWNAVIILIICYRYATAEDVQTENAIEEVAIESI